MVYSKKFIAILKVGGRILREFNHENISELESECSLLLPFGAEYSLMFKNLESRPATLRVWIDGEDVLGGNSIIVRAGKSVDLDGFMDVNGRVKNRFKFIQKTEQIAEYRGDRIDDGMIRIEWRFEKPKPIVVDNYVNWIRPEPWYPSWPWTYTIACGGRSVGGSVANGTLNSSSGNYTAKAADVQFTNTIGCDVFASCAPLEDEGITVKGSEANQYFSDAYIGALEENAHVIVIRLRGTFATQEKVKAPLEIKTKIQCSTCGNMVKSGNKFCSNCGTCVVSV